MDRSDEKCPLAAVGHRPECLVLLLCVGARVVACGKVVPGLRDGDDDCRAAHPSR